MINIHVESVNSTWNGRSPQTTTTVASAIGQENSPTDVAG